MYVALLHQPDRADYDTSSLRTCISGGALPVEVLRGFDAAFGVPVLEGYGLSETSPVASFNLPGAERKPGSISGTPIRGRADAGGGRRRQRGPVGEVGEIVILGPNVMEGYWQRPEATAEAIRDGWFHTGDLARVDNDGYFYIVDRKKDLIIRGGYNVYPREIEEVIYEHPAVAEAAVIGLPHSSLGEEVTPAAPPSSEVPPSPPRNSATTSRARSRRTSTRVTCGSSTRCPRARLARSRNATSSYPPTWPRPDPEAALDHDRWGVSFAARSGQYREESHAR